MTFSQDTMLRVAILVLSIFGFWVARRIRNHKTKDAPLVCPIGFDCHAVVHSDYSKFMGMPVELAGMIYYALIALAYLAVIFFSSSLPMVILNNILLGISFVAFLFSLYLIGIQIFILKKGCSWCIVSACISTVIFILSFYGAGGAWQMFS